eukprot:scaffold434_cov186-Pinguiococcus_pyrenoidosus.AAC.21
MTPARGFLRISARSSTYISTYKVRKASAPTSPNFLPTCDFATWPPRPAKLPWRPSPHLSTLSPGAAAAAPAVRRSGCHERSSAPS